MNKLVPAMTDDIKPVSNNLPKTAFIRTFWSFFIALCLIYGSLLALSPRVYSSDAFLEILPNATNVPPTIDPASTGGTPKWLSAEFEFMQSPAILKSVAEELQLDKKWGRKYNGGPPLSAQESLSILTNRISLYVLRQTPVIEISAFSFDPAESAQIANTIVQTYRSSVVSEHRPVSVRTLDMARPPLKANRANIPFAIVRGLIRSLIFAFLAAVTAGGIAIGVLQMKRNRPPITAREEKRLPRFQKY